MTAAKELAAQLVATVRDLSEARSALDATRYERDAVAQDLAQVASTRHRIAEEYAEAHNRLVWLAAEIGWATDGRLPTAVRHIEEVLRHRTAERDVLAARLAAVEAAIRDHSREYFSPARRIEAVPVDVLRAALAAPTDTTKEN